ncbi:DNA binding methylated-DNA-cysteine S-methyltransferase [Mycena chlorophos]|uniref:Methylated-DNA--protein-cysteine methyltransferase n=1 Tax=Mycena chlorophos TaxID=658473 RepID=A0A8H6TM31_MYCCL|nr:DNA binding methylated-DNA-cysteine S-methyltransferase [Mycena chlorophos]
MPVVRTSQFKLPAIHYAPVRAKQEETYYPTTQALREQYRTDEGKRVTAHQWDVYDYTRTIPAGKVVTYKDVCNAVGGSPRSVGGALRTNPFAPFVPCHRVVASNLFIGGFLGEWGREHKTGTQCDRKLTLLAQEGVAFTEDGYLKSRELLWKTE